MTASRSRLNIALSGDFASLRNEWDGLHSAMNNPSVFSSWEYANLWYTHFANPSAVALLTAHWFGDLVGVVPLVRANRGPLRILCGLTNDHCFQSEPLIVPEHREEFMAVAGDWFSNRQRSCDYLQYDYSYSFSPSPDLINDARLREAGSKWERVSQPTYTAFLSGSFEDYLRNGITTKARRNFQQAMKQLGPRHSWELLTFRGEEALAHWGVFLNLEDSGWKGSQKSSIVRSLGCYQDYYRDFTRLLASRGTLLMFFLMIDGNPAAGIFGYTDGSIYHSAKTGYDPRYGRYSPSNILLVLAIEHLSKNTSEIGMFHMFPWDYGYKHRYGHTEERCGSLRLYGETMRGRAFHALRRLKQIYRNRLGSAR